MPKPQNNLVTKDYLDKRLDEFGNKLKNELLEIKDEIVGEIKAMREEFNTHQYSHSRIEGTLGDHKKHISVVENRR